ncbi:hypothetical protein EJD97_009109 [Solanum chilense]|uniref:Uncharacterized protein n=1 Tax=Solanum chilense TaxID=4083 RepID=A0A6N2C9N6_SOLCI|nr:hypothetical protein EJD97_009109 [Solanum chilense]
MAPFGTFYGRRFRSHIGWFEVGESSLLGPEVIYEALEKVWMVRDRFRTTYFWVMRFGKRGKLSPRYVRPSGNSVSILPIKVLGVDENLSYKEVSVEILDRQVKKLRNKEMDSVKVIWTNHLFEGATQEAEVDMKSRNPHLFPQNLSKS